MIITANPGDRIYKVMKVEKINVAEEEAKTGRRIWDRYFKFYNKDGKLHPNSTFYTYPTDSLVLAGKKEITKVEGIKYTGTLRDYQIEAVLHIVENGCGLIDAKTGAGKSHIIMSCVKAMSRKTLVVCHNIKTINEMREKFKSFTNIDPGIYYGKEKNIKEITITTRNSFLSMNGFPSMFDFIIFDECDDGVTEKLVGAIINSDCISFMGLTGTPSRIELSPKQLELLYGPSIKVGGYQMSPSKVVQINYVWNDEEIMNVDYTRQRHGIKDSILLNETRTKVMAQSMRKIIASRFCTLILIDRTESLYVYQEEFKDIKNVFVIHGDTKDEDDKAAIAICEKEGGVILGAFKKMYRGVDVPIIDCVIIASSIKIPKSIIQGMGRGLRVDKDKVDCHIYILNDSILKTQRNEQAKGIMKEHGIYPTLVKVSAADLTL